MQHDTYKIVNGLLDSINHLPTIDSVGYWLEYFGKSIHVVVGDKTVQLEQEYHFPKDLNAERD